MTRAVRWAAVALLVAVTVLVYAPALDASFQFDDYNVILRDPRVQSLGAWAASMPGMRPLLKLSYALNHELGGGARGFRLLNVAIHALNAVLVLLLVGRLSSRHGLAARPALGVAFAVALVFALHPAQTEAVTYVSGRSSALVALGCLATMLAWLRAVEASTAAARDIGAAVARIPARGWAALFAALALATKEAAVVLPLVLLLWVATTPGIGALRRMHGAPAGAGSTVPGAGEAPGHVPSGAAVVRASWPLLLVFAAVGVALLSLAPYREIIAASLARRGSWHNLLGNAEAIPWLAGQMFRIGAMNADPDLRVPGAPSPALVLRLVVIAVVIAAALASRRRRPALAFGVLWFFVWLLPTHSLLPREDLANDRQLYLALVGPAWLAVYGAWLALQGLRSRVPARVVASVAATVIAALAVVLASVTVARNRVYTTEVSFWEDAARRSPHKARTANNLGYAYALACRDADALAAFARAAALDPADSRSRVNYRLLEDGTLLRDGERHCRVP